MDERISRRGFGTLVSKALGGAALGLLGVLGWRYAAWSAPAKASTVFPPEPGTWEVRQLGRVLLIRDGETVRALSARCSHLGCTVAPADDGETLVCPCHGSRYTLDGEVLEGPAAEPLQSLDVTTLDDGSNRVVAG